MGTPIRTVDLRRLNRQILLKRIYFGGPVSRVELRQRTDLSAATITNVSTDLLSEGIIFESGSLESEGGRPATLLAVNPAYGYIIGVDLGETHVQLELFNLMLQNRLTIRKSLDPTQNSPELFVDTIADGVAELITQSGIDSQRLLGIGIGVPGVVEHNGGVGVLAPIWNWKRAPLLEMLQVKLTYPIYLDNGAKAMTLAESWFGAGQEVQDLVVILIGTGIGAGIITEGVLYRGVSNAAGEWGHSKIELNGRSCRCGSRGCIEAYAGAKGIMQTVQAIESTSPLTVIEEQMGFISNLAAQSVQGDPTAKEALQQTAKYLGAGIANLVNLFNPELILLGGWVGLEIGDQILDTLTGFVEQYALPPAFQVVDIRLCELGADAVCIGAACLVLEDILAMGG